MIGLFLLAAVNPVTTCHQVAGERLHLSDLAAADARFAAAADQTADVGYAPAGNAKRVFSGEELLRIARQRGVAQPERFAPICFERAVSMLNPEGLLAALHESLGIPGADIELVDFSRYPVNPGTLSFDRKQLVAPPASSPARAVYWRGAVVQESGRRSPVWARVIVTVKQHRVVAAQYLKAGAVLQASDLRVEDYSGFPLPAGSADSIEPFVGNELLRAQRSGASMVASMVTTPSDISRGDVVHVDVTAGAAHLEFDGEAAGSGHKGEVISIRNPKTKKLFLARVSGKGAASVTEERLRVAR